MKSRLVETNLVAMNSEPSESDEEERLSGGNTAQSVVRFGSTVRKPATPSTPAVQGFVTHLRAVGFQAAPKPLGVDSQERQVWQYVPGPYGTAAWLIANQGCAVSVH